MPRRFRSSAGPMPESCRRRGEPIAPEEIAYESSGIRPKLRAKHEAEEKDFVVSLDAPGLINLVGIESPGLTSALAIAALVESLL